MSPERVLAAMETGPMIAMAVGRTAADRRAIAQFVTAKSFGRPLVTAPSQQAMCPPNASDFTNPLTGSLWNTWGENTSNTRYQESAGFTAADVPRLKLKWAFGFPGDLSEGAQPTFAGGRVFVGSSGGNVYSLNAATGCVHWFFQPASAVRAAVTIGRIETSSGAMYAAFIADRAANVYALEAATGKLLWKTKADNFPLAGVSGSPTFYNGRLYVGITAGEERAGGEPAYPCCRFRGTVVALNAANGDQIWRSYTITEEARPTKKNKIGTQLWGPSGASIWTAPAIDAQRNAVYVTTGDNYSDPPTETSDAFMAFDLDSGKVLWSRQTTPADAWNESCERVERTSCPDPEGPDFDYASPPILVTLSNGRRALVAGQKSGFVHALDPDRQGEVLWSTRIGTGPPGNATLGGIQFGCCATDQANAYVALSDISVFRNPNIQISSATEPNPKLGGGMFALRLDNGELVWHTPPPSCGKRKRCSPAQSAAVSAIPGIVFSGSVDGHLRAFSTSTGAIVWDFDTVRSYHTVNNVSARGGSLNRGGPAIAGGMMFVTSGYAANGIRGNVLLVFSVDGK